MSAEIGRLARAIAALAPHPKQGLPEEVFLLISRLTPLVNVDLLVQDDRGRTLLTWREDRYSPPGWHIPGGVIRFKERAVDRVRAVARLELGVTVDFEPLPIAMHEIIHPRRDERGHSVSLLFRCRLRTPLDSRRRFRRDAPRGDAWQWHAHYPPDMIAVHAIYRRFFAPNPASRRRRGNAVLARARAKPPARPKSPPP